MPGQFGQSTIIIDMTGESHKLIHIQVAQCGAHSFYKHLKVIKGDPKLDHQDLFVAFLLDFAIRSVDSRT
jgi:hypothetical protein